MQDRMSNPPRWTGIAEWVIVIAAAISVLILILPRLSVFPATDEGVYMTVASRINRGEVIYRDFFQFLPPGYFYLIAAIEFGFNAGFAGARAFMVVCLFAHACLLFSLARRVISIPLGAGVFAGMFLLYQCSHRSTLSHHFVALLLSDLTLLSLVRHFEGRRFGLLTAAAATAGCALCTQTHGALTILAVCVSVLCVRGRRDGQFMREIGAVAAVVAGVACACAVCLALSGALPAAAYDTVIWVFTHYRKFDSGVPYNGGLVALSDALHSPGGLLARLDRAGWLLTAGYAQIAGMVSLGVLVAIRRKKHGAGEISRAALLCLPLFACANWLTCYSFPNAFLIAQASVLGYLCACAVFLFCARGLVKWHPRTGWAVICVCCLCVAVEAARTLSHLVKENSRSERIWFETRRGALWTTRGGMTSQVAVLRFLNENLAPQSSLFVLNWSAWLYYLGEYHNPTRYDGLWPLYNSDDQVNETVGCLSATRPRFIVRDGLLDLLIARGDHRFRIFRNTELEKWPAFAFVNERYDLKHQFGPYRIYELKDVSTGDQPIGLKGFHALSTTLPGARGSPPVRWLPLPAPWARGSALQYQ